MLIAARVSWEHRKQTQTRPPRGRSRRLGRRSRGHGWGAPSSLQRGAARSLGNFKSWLLPARPAGAEAGGPRVSALPPAGAAVTTDLPVVRMGDRLPHSACGSSGHCGRREQSGPPPPRPRTSLPSSCGATSIQPPQTPILVENRAEQTGRILREEPAGRWSSGHLGARLAEPSRPRARPRA